MTKTAWLLEFEYKDIYGQVKFVAEWHTSHDSAQNRLEAFSQKFGILRGSIKRQYDRGNPEV